MAGKNGEEKKREKPEIAETASGTVKTGAVENDSRTSGFPPFLWDLARVEGAMRENIVFTPHVCSELTEEWSGPHKEWQLQRPGEILNYSSSYCMLVRWIWEVGLFFLGRRGAGRQWWGGGGNKFFGNNFRL